MLVGAPLKRAGARRAADEHLRELEELADTAGAVVVGQVLQQLEKPHPGTYLGSGKIDELRDMVSDRSASLGWKPRPRALSRSVRSPTDPFARS